VELLESAALDAAADLVAGAFAVVVETGVAATTGVAVVVGVVATGVDVDGDGLAELEAEAEFWLVPRFSPAESSTVSWTEPGSIPNLESASEIASESSLSND